MPRPKRPRKTPATLEAELEELSGEIRREADALQCAANRLARTLRPRTASGGGQVENVGPLLIRVHTAYHRVGELVMQRRLLLLKMNV